eukprot:scaffold89095_cov36-Phaeocystis_antarctica.AAC.1
MTTTGSPLSRTRVCATRPWVGALLPANFNFLCQQVSERGILRSEKGKNVEHDATVCRCIR